jgi:hypothetical protein
MIVRDLHVILFKFSDILGCFSSPYLQYWAKNWRRVWLGVAGRILLLRCKF